MRDTRRYLGVGLTYDNGPLSVSAVYESHLFDHRVAKYDIGDSHVFSLGASYDFTSLKVYVYGQYMKDVRQTSYESFFGIVWVDDDDTGELSALNADGYALHVGVAVPTASFGTFRIGAYFADLDANYADDTIRNYNFLIADEFALSKRTMLYGGVAYEQVEADDNKSVARTKVTQVVLGLMHTF